MPSQTFFNLPEEKRKVIIDTAIDEFADHGFGKASTNRIVKAAGIPKGSLYQYFDGKKDLFLYIIELAIQEKTAFALTIPPELFKDQTFFGRLRLQVRLGIDFERKHRNLSRAYAKFITGEESEFKEEVMKKLNLAAGNYISAMVKEAMEKKEIRADVDVDMAALVIQTVMTAFGNYMLGYLDKDAPGEFVTEEFISSQYDALISILEQGLGTKGGVSE